MRIDPDERVGHVVVDVDIEHVQLASATVGEPLDERFGGRVSSGVVVGEGDVVATGVIATPFAQCTIDRR